jgi:hypothetical protein
MRGNNMRDDRLTIAISNDENNGFYTIRMYIPAGLYPELTYKDLKEDLLVNVMPTIRGWFSKFEWSKPDEVLTSGE